MSKWIEEKGGGEIDQILEGHGTQFVVRFVSYSKPQCWRIKESPFLLDVHKSFVNLGEAKEYCERRYQELFGQREELTRLRADLAAVTERMSKLDFERTVAELERDSLRAENERMREAVKPLIEIEDYPDTILMKRIRDLRAALEGMTEPLATHKEPDEHLNLKNAECLPSTVAAIKPEPPR